VSLSDKEEVVLIGSVQAGCRPDRHLTPVLTHLLTTVLDGLGRERNHLTRATSWAGSDCGSLTC
jgi:hypothetical protein